MVFAFDPLKGRKIKGWLELFNQSYLHTQFIEVLYRHALWLESIYLKHKSDVLNCFLFQIDIGRRRILQVF